MSNLLPQTNSTASATGNPRNKTALKPGHSLMDWIRLRSSGVDLAGTKGVVTPVTLAELKKHNKKTDAWMAIRGKVYNVTRYMDFHPGGVDELTKGIGKDATKIFDDVHAWVNYDQMLNKCYIGPLYATMGASASASSSPTKIASSSSSSQLNTGSSLTANFRLPFSISASNFISNTMGQSAVSSSSAVNVSTKPDSTVSSCGLSVSAVDADAPQIIPRFDWIQKTSDLVIIFYTRAFCNPGLLIRCPDDGDVSTAAAEVKIYVGDKTFLVKFTFTDSVQWPCTVRNNVDSGKVEISFKKATPKLWSSYGTMEMTKMTDSDSNEYEYEVTDRQPVNHDSFALQLKPTRPLMMYLPIGHHISITCQLSAGQEISRSYTPVPHSYIATQQITGDNSCIFLLIKSYDNGTLSKHLCHHQQASNSERGLVKGLRISPPMGSFSMLQLKSHNRIAFLAAGSGITPFLGIMEQYLNKPNSQLEQLSLQYYNKTESDIWCRARLDEIAERETRFQIKYILSDGDANWEGDRGRITRDQIVALTDAQSKDHATFIGVCGPPAFNRQIVEFLKAVGFPAASQHVFQG